MAKIGIYGGTFNPIHNTHIQIALAAKKQFRLDHIYFLIAGEPPHKDTADFISSTSRLELLELTIEDFSDFSVDSREIYRSGKSYSYITLAEYKEEHPKDKLFFIMGSDSFFNFDSWVNPEKIASCANILVAPRLGDNLEKINLIKLEYQGKYKSDFEIIDYIPNSLSSSYIRENADKLDKIKDFLPEKALDYIVNHNLYAKKYDFNDAIEIEDKLKKELKNGRYIHTIGVANTAFLLAGKWNYPDYNAMLAGLLHDCAKCLTDEKRISICKKNNIEIRPIEAKYPHLLHGKVGAFLAKEKYGVDDEQILHAIAVHTTGVPNMNLLDKIIFVADYIEPGRNKQPRLDLLRKVAFEDLDECVYMILEDTITYLDESPDMVDETTIETYNFYKNKREV